MLLARYRRLCPTPATCTKKSPLRPRRPLLGIEGYPMRVDDTPEQVWRAQEQKAKLQKDSASLRLKMIGGIVCFLLAAGLAVYLDLK